MENPTLQVSAFIHQLFNKCLLKLYYGVDCSQQLGYISEQNK